MMRPRLMKMAIIGAGAIGRGQKGLPLSMSGISDENSDHRCRRYRRLV
jgi:hypothetical protein